MAIYRGSGGSGDATADTSNTSAVAIAAANDAQDSANAAAASAVTASNAATSTAGSVAAAATSATNAATSASTATTQAGIATTKASEASTSATNAATSATNAASSATSASGSATTATTKASEASTSATNAATSASSASTSATSASSSASTATTKASEASTSATNAAASATTATTQATNAASSATSASGSATTATTQASAASTSATNAASSASAASTSATSASTSATTATTQAGIATTQATNSATSAAASAAARDAALAALDSFDDRYLGTKSADPTLDNDGNALVSGALYFNTVSNSMKVYDGSLWLAAYASLSGALLSANNLSDVTSVSSSRTNLGLGTMATQDASSVAITGGTLNGTLGATTPSTAVVTSLTSSALTSGRITYASTGGLLADSANLVWDGTNARLGIGTASPRGTLEVQLSTSNDEAIRFNRPAIGYGGFQSTGNSGSIWTQSKTGYATELFRIQSYTGLTQVFASTGQPLAFGTNNTERMRIDSAGNVGIGTASPQDTLEISKSGGAYLRLSNSNTASVSEAIGGIKFYSADASGSQNIVRTLIESYTNVIGATSDLRFSTTPDGVGATPIERMRINTEGNLGLGVTPSAWGSGFKAQQIGSSLSLWGTPTASSNAGMMTNTYIDSAGNSIYVSSSYAAHYQQYQGGHYWSTAPSGTAGTTVTLTQRMLLDVSGNLGLGVTPSAWNLSGYEALEVGAVGNGIFSGNNDTIITANAYYNAGWKYAANYQATFYEQNAGAHIWKTAATGTAGNAITFTQAMTLSAAGNLGIGTTSPARTLSVYNASSAFSSFQTSVSGTTSTDGLIVGADGSNAYVYNYENTPIIFGTNATERMRLDTNGNLLVGTTSATSGGAKLQTVDGITFPATQVASANANTLDDYEEGTFTPTIIGTTTAGTGTYSANSQIGRYTRIGNRVYFNIYLVWTAHTGTGNMRISGLPFTSIATTNTFNAVSTWNANIALTASNLLTAYVNVNATTVELRQYSTGGGADAAIPIDTAGSIMVAGHYEV